MALPNELVAPPLDPPKGYEISLNMISDRMLEIYRTNRVPYFLQAKMADAGFGTPSEVANRWKADDVPSKGPVKLGLFTPAVGGTAPTPAAYHHNYDEEKVEIAMTRLKCSVEDAQLWRKRKLEETDAPAFDDYKALLGRGDREELRAAYKATFHRQAPVEYEGSDHLMGMVKKAVSRGELPALELKNLVPHLPRPGDVKFQKRKENDRESYVEEEASNPENEYDWKRTMMIFRTSLLMGIALYPVQARLRLKEEELDEFYEFLYGEDIMRKKPTPSLAVVRIAERKAWRHMAIELAKDPSITLASMLKRMIVHPHFWHREIYEFCRKKDEKGSGKSKKEKKKAKLDNTWYYPNDKGGKGGKDSKGGKAGKAKGKSKKGGKAKKGQDSWQWGSGTGDNQQQQLQTKPDRHQWAVSLSSGKEPCKKYHAHNNCPHKAKDCQRDHLCPVILPDGTACEKNHRAADHK